MKKMRVSSRRRVTVYTRKRKTDHSVDLGPDYSFPKGLIKDQNQAVNPGQAKKYCLIYKIRSQTSQVFSDNNSNCLKPCIATKHPHLRLLHN